MGEDFNMLMTNAFIALCKRMKGIPDSLRNLGYEIEGIESEFAIGNNKKCNPDIVISSSKTKHSMVIEFKSGANIEDEQKQRYLMINSDILRDYALIPIDRLSTFDIAYVCKEEHKQTIEQGLNGTGFAILLKMADRIEASANTTLKNDDTDASFKPLLVNWEKMPVSFYPFDKDCSSKLIADYIMQQIFDFMAEEKNSLLVDEVLEKVFVHWRKIGKHKQQELRQKAKEVMQLAGRYEFSRFLQYNAQQSRKGTCARFDVTSNPFIDNRDRRQKVWKDMNKLLESFLARLEGNITPTLFDNVES